MAKFATDNGGIELLEVVEELDVSGGAEMSKRHGLRGALEKIEAGRADGLIVGYFDRLARSTETGMEVMRRLAAVRGRLYVAEEGEQKIDTPDAWFVFTIKMATAELYRKQAGVKTHAAKANAIARGVPTFNNITPGYVQPARGKPLEPDPVLAPVVRKAFEMRADGASWNTVRAHLRAHGIVRCLRGTVNLLKSRMVLGELHFGELVNLAAHEAIVDLEVWNQVQRRQKVRGRYSEKPRLLGRLGLVRCGSCGTAMHVGGQTARGKSFPDYRCPGRAAGAACERSMSIHAGVLEPIVEAEAQTILEGRRGTHQAEQRVARLEADLRAAEADRDELIEGFRKVRHVPSAAAQINEAQLLVEALMQELEAAKEAADPIFYIYADQGWQKLSFEEKRRLIRASFVSITILPRTAASRVRFEYSGRQTFLE